ncbi:MAG: hypothetical protein LBP53_02920 [Candidatus Peribacteria bacterium]|nr:hypothetical protein [Candidatus Peribacteria bacterium]
MAEVKARNLKDQQRYKKLYNIEVWKYENYTLVIDTTERTPEEIVDIILKEFEARQLKHKKGNGKNKAETPPLSKANRKPSLLKNVLLLLALGVIVGIRVVAVMLAN